MHNTSESSGQTRSFANKSAGIANAGPMSDFNAPAKRRWIWALAACGSVALHGAVIGSIVAHWHDEADHPALGAPAMEVELLLTAPRVEPSDLPPGQNVQASVARPAADAQKEAKESTDLPQAVPAKTDDPDALEPMADKRPKQDASTERAASEPSVAAIATAIPHPEAAEVSARSISPAQGTGESTQRIRATWEKELAAHFDKYKRYPSDRAHREAELTVTFELDRTGHILSTHIVRGSGDTSFDEAGLAMMRRADPVPAPPPPVANEGLTFTMPIIFHGRS
jgi:TonB family protein